MPSEIKLYNEDCLSAMKQIPDKAFDLAIVDPPYGINFGTFNRTNIAEQGKRVKANRYKNGIWDNTAPEQEYFNHIKRCSVDQIIWGGNYYNLGPSRGFIFWYKKNPVPNFSDGEFAWTSFNKIARCFDYAYYGNINSESVRIHPTQKPVALYKWILKNYAKEGDKILDTHLGSGSIAIACYDMGFDLTGYEIDKDYYDAAVNRLDNHKKQLTLF